ncbi:MauE/DoxX family redox-associated membrane protein [Thermostaphylospora chromogena]|uniref:Methylamine utilisation protein MauE n=1 Tax=Thermostaphylospora chromogena TaxID=35622 RepID=A0A1H1EEK8_9ACTN|nr:MauE/DoxX family redox-associated membrane protein [Thermostaphylospora chromogena]SDQ87192.1 Methylamine utilisation protein MauE [Thermostaphylospora chromogena]
MEYAHYVVWGVQFTLAGVFLAALAGKLRDGRARAGFVSAVTTIAAVPRGWAGAVGTAVMGVEAAVVVTVLVPATRVIGLILAAGTLTVFAAALGRALASGRRSSCACFGARSSPLAWRHVVRNVLLAGAAAAAAGHAALAPPVPPQALGVLTAALAATPVVILIVSLDDLWELITG